MRVPPRQQADIGGGFDRTRSVEQLQARPFQAPDPHHVVAVQHAVEFIEPLALRSVLAASSEMPLADAGRRVARFLQMLCQGELGGMQPLHLLGDQNARDARTNGMAARQQCGARRRAGRSRRVELRQPNALGRHAVERRSADIRIAVAPKVAEAEVVGHDHNEVRRTPGRVGDLSAQAAEARPRERWSSGLPASGRFELQVPRLCPRGYSRRSRNRLALCSQRGRLRGGTPAPRPAHRRSFAPPPLSRGMRRALLQPRPRPRPSRRCASR